VATLCNKTIHKSVPLFCSSWCNCRSPAAERV